MNSTVYPLHAVHSLKPTLSLLTCKSYKKDNIKNLQKITKESGYDQVKVHNVSGKSLCLLILCKYWDLSYI